MHVIRFKLNKTVLIIQITEMQSTRINQYCDWELLKKDESFRLNLVVLLLTTKILNA